VITVNATAKPITYQCLNNANASYIGMNACDTSSSNYWAMTLSWGGWLWRNGFIRPQDHYQEASLSPVMYRITNRNILKRDGNSPQDDDDTLGYQASNNLRTAPGDLVPSATPSITDAEGSGEEPLPAPHPAPETDVPFDVPIRMTIEPDIPLYVDGDFPNSPEIGDFPFEDPNFPDMSPLDFPGGFDPNFPGFDDFPFVPFDNLEGV
jgi:hypothetical protein